MAAALLAEDRERGRDAVEQALHVDVDHQVPVVDAQVVEGRDRHDAGVADEHVEPAELLACGLDQGAQVLAAGHVGDAPGGRAATHPDVLGDLLEQEHADVVAREAAPDAHPGEPKCPGPQR